MDEAATDAQMISHYSSTKYAQRKKITTVARVTSKESRYSLVVKFYESSFMSWHPMKFLAQADTRHSVPRYSMLLG
jgi:hypothetical protein